MVCKSRCSNLLCLFLKVIFDFVKSRDVFAGFAMAVATGLRFVYKGEAIDLSTAIVQVY
jgi:hypothetical protein